MPDGGDGGEEEGATGFGHERDVGVDDVELHEETVEDAVLTAVDEDEEFADDPRPVSECEGTKPPRSIALND